MIKLNFLISMGIRLEIRRLAISAALLAAATMCHGASAPTFTEFTVASGAPGDITSGPDGNLWFTLQEPAGIGRITVAGFITEFPLISPSAATSTPVGITTGPDENLWFADPGGNQIGSVTPAGAITLFPVPLGSNPRYIAAGVDGNLWFTGTVGNVGRITTAGVVTLFPLRTSSATGSGIVSGPDGNLWFTEAVGKIARITTAGAVTEFPLPDPASVPLHIAAGPDGNLWFTEQAGVNIGRITTAGVISEFPAPNIAALEITARSDGLWFVDANNLIGTITTAGAINEFTIPTPNSAPIGIAVGLDANIWFTESAGKKIGKLVTGPIQPTPTTLTVGIPQGFGRFTATQNGASLTQNLTLDTTDHSAALFSAGANSLEPNPWLFVTPLSGDTPQILQVSANPANLPPASYIGSITIASPDLPLGPFVIPVTLVVTPPVTVMLSNNGPLDFWQMVGGAAPPAQTITVSGLGAGASIQTAVPSVQACNWLIVLQSSGPAGRTVTFTPQPNSLRQGTYDCPVTFSFPDSSIAPIVVQAILLVGTAPTITANLASLSFAYSPGGADPAAQQFTVVSTGGMANFAVGTASSGGWLTTDAGTGPIATPMTIHVSIIPANIPVTATGTTIQGEVVITQSGFPATIIDIPVSLTVAGPSIPTPIRIFNSATGTLGGGIAPGEVLTIQGINLAPASPAAGTSFSINPNGTVSGTLDGVQVSFGGLNGTPTYVSPTQINVVVPWEIAGKTSATIAVNVNGVPSAGFPENVVSVAPGIYTLSATGVGQAAALNQDLSINGPATGVALPGGTIQTAPAAVGTVISVFGTGGGLTNPSGVTGTITPVNQLYPLMNWTPGSSVVTATVGGIPATVPFAGAAPGEISGVWQINIQIPSGLTSGAQPLAITIDGRSTQSNVMIAVQ